MLDENNQPVAVIQVQSVDVLPMNEVSEEFALAEGEGDYNFWWRAHEEFFTNELKPYGKTFSPDLMVVCERFVNLSLKIINMFRVHKKLLRTKFLKAFSIISSRKTAVTSFLKTAHTF